MAHNVTTGQPLTEFPDFPALFVDWLRGHDDLGSATGEWSRYISSAARDAIAPAWADTTWVASWWAEFQDYLPDEASVAQAQANLQLLSEGKAEAVFTGQQPGAMGGPLYTLYKVASAIEIARWRSEAGRPTVPVFWLGDDDPDLLEALKSRIYDAERRCFLAIPGGELPKDSMVGEVPASVWEAGTAGWLEEKAVMAMVRDLAAIWRQAVDGEESVSMLFKKMILRAFPGTGLLIVSGNDSGLHRLAAPLYEKILPRLDHLREMVQERGETLVEKGWHAQITTQSLETPLHEIDGRRRRKFPAPTIADAGLLRPGVMLRALVQDWLFQPLAVALGPAELSYHFQLLPLYAELDIHKPVWLPRLFATATSRVLKAETADESPSTTEFKRVTFNALVGTEKELIEFLTQTSGMKKEDAEAEVKYLLNGLESRIMSFLDRQQARLDIAAMENTDPWLAPYGKRQERIMSNVWALSQWGEDLIQNIKLAAYVHFKRGADGNWLEMIMKVETI